MTRLGIPYLSEGRDQFGAEGKKQSRKAQVKAAVSCKRSGADKRGTTPGCRNHVTKQRKKGLLCQVRENKPESEQAL